MLGVQGELVHVALDAHGRLGRLVELRLRHMAQFTHASQHVQLALFGALGIDDRVVAGRRLGQPRQHRRFGQGELVERLAEIDLRCGCEAVGPLAQVDLVHVELEDLVLLETVLDLECEQRLVDLARKRLLGRQEEIARDLHGDRTGALPAAPRGEVRHGGAHDALVVDPRMLVEPLVLGRQDRALEDLGHFGDLYHRAPLFTEFADQNALSGVHAQRDFGLVIGEDLKRGQVGPREDDDQPNGAGANRRDTRKQGQRKRQKTKPHQGDRSPPGGWLHRVGDGGIISSAQL